MDDTPRKNGQDLTPANPRGAGRPSGKTIHQKPQDLTLAVKMAKEGKRAAALKAYVNSYLDKPYGTRLTDEVIAAIMARISCGETLAASCAAFEVNPAAILMRCMYDTELKQQMKECRAIAGDIAFDQIRDLLTRSDMNVSEKKFAFEVLKHLSQNLNRSEYATNQPAPPVAIQINFTDREDRML